VSNSVDGRSVTSKLAAILRTFSSGRAHSLSDVARSAGIPVSTAHRLVTELVEWGFLDRAPDKRYCVGSLLTQIGANVWHVPRIQSQAEQVLDDLSSAVHSTVRFGVLDKSSVKCLEKRPTPNGPARFYSRRLPVHATAAGKALLAFSEPDTVNEVIRLGLRRYTAATIVTGSALRRELTMTRISQLAWARKELEPEITSVAAPVFARGGQVVAALEVSITGSAPQYRMQAIQPALIVAARALTRQFAVNQVSAINKYALVGGEISQLAMAKGRLA
jgi:DNA-binding IclR family transcriptional regulator